MKILVDKELVEDALDRMIWAANQESPRKPGDGSDFDRVITILQNFLDTDDKKRADRVIEENIQAIKESFTKNSCKITVSSIPEIQNLIDLELINHRAILHILDIMMNSTCNRGWNRDTEMRTQIKELHKQLRGVRYELS